MTNEEYNRMINGDTDVFCRFYEQYAPNIYQQIVNKTNNAAESKSLLKDIFSDCCVRMRNAGENADLISLLLEALCDKHIEKFTSGTEISAIMTDETSEDENSDFAETKKTPEEILAEDSAQESVDAVQEESVEASADAVAPEAAVADTTTKADKEVPTEDVQPAVADTESAVSEDTSPTIIFDGSPEEPAPKKKKKKRHVFLWVILITFLTLLLLVLCWALIGVLGAEEIIPSIDLGYEWFNTNIYPFFK